MSRWPVAGPSEYWLLTSSPASKVKRQPWVFRNVVHINLLKHPVSYIYNLHTEFAFPHTVIPMACWWQQTAVTSPSSGVCSSAWTAFEREGGRFLQNVGICLGNYTAPRLKAHSFGNIAITKDSLLSFADKTEILLQHRRFKTPWRHFLPTGVRTA